MTMSILWARPCMAWTLSKVLCSTQFLCILCKHGSSMEGAILGANTVRLSSDCAMNPHFPDASIHVLHTLLRIMMQLLSYTTLCRPVHVTPLRTHDSRTCVSSFEPGFDLKNGIMRMYCTILLYMGYPDSIEQTFGENCCR
jgi:hypothetical protein